MKYSFPQIFVEFCDKIWPCWELNVITFKKKKKKRKKKRKLIKSWCRYYSHTTFYYTSFLLYTRRVDALRYVTSLLREIFFLLFFFSVNLLLIDNILRGINKFYTHDFHKWFNLLWIFIKNYTLFLSSCMNKEFGTSRYDVRWNFSVIAFFF